MSELTDDIAGVLNRHSMENGSNTPDFILADYLMECLKAFDKTSRSREAWYGKSLSIGGSAQPSVATAPHKAGALTSEQSGRLRSLWLESDPANVTPEASSVCRCGTTLVCPDIGCDSNKSGEEAATVRSVLGKRYERPPFSVEAEPKAEASSEPAQESAQPTLDDVLAILRRWYDSYPLDVFGELPPPPAMGERETASRDCIAGAMGRHMSQALQQEMRELWSAVASTGTAPQGWQPIEKDETAVNPKPCPTCGSPTWIFRGRTAVKGWFKDAYHTSLPASPPPEPTTGGQG